MKRTSKMWEEEFEKKDNWEIMLDIESLGLRFLRFKLAPIYKMQALRDKFWSVESYFYNGNLKHKDFFYPYFETKKSLLSRLAKGEFE